MVEVYSFRFLVTRKYGIGIDLSTAADDQWEIAQGNSYRWKDWRLIKSRDSFFIWCDAVALEFRSFLYFRILQVEDFRK